MAKSQKSINLLEDSIWGVSLRSWNNKGFLNTEKELNMKEIFDKFNHMKLRILSIKRFPEESEKTRQCSERILAICKMAVQ